MYSGSYNDASYNDAHSTQTFSMPRGGKTKTKLRRKLSRKNKGGKRRTRRKRAGQPFGQHPTTSTYYPSSASVSPSYIPASTFAPANPNTSMGRMLNDYTARHYAPNAGFSAGYNTQQQAPVYTGEHYGYNTKYPQSASYHMPVTVTAQGTYFGRR